MSTDYYPLSCDFLPTGSRAKYGKRLRDGIYQERDILYCEHIPSEIVLNTKQIKEVIVYRGLISVVVLNFPNGANRPWTDARTFDGYFSVEIDSRNANHNIHVDNSCKLVIHKRAEPRPLNFAEIRSMEILEESLKDDVESKNGEYKEAK